MTGASILIVEDDPIVATDLKHKVRDFGYRVCATAASGEDAIAAAHQHRPAAVLMDITLEGKVDGVRAADDIRKELSIPVVFLTAHSDSATVERAKLTLPFGYVLKPVREIELKIALEMALYSGRRTLHKSSQPDGRRPSSSVRKLDPVERAEVVKVLQTVAPFSKVRATLLDDIADSCYIREYRTLEILSMEGDKSEETDGFLVLSGRIAMLKTSASGRELAVQLLGPHSTFGLLACLDTPSQELTIRAQTESKVLHVPKSSLLYLLSEMPDLYPDLLAELSRRLHALHSMARSLAHDRVEVRVAAALVLFLEQQQGAESALKAAEVRMSRQELANLSGTTVETAIRVTRNFEKDGILELPDHRVIKVVHPAKLQTIAAGEEL